MFKSSNGVLDGGPKILSKGNARIIYTFNFGLNTSVKGRDLIRMVPVMPLTDAGPFLAFF